MSVAVCANPACGMPALYGKLCRGCEAGVYGAKLKAAASVNSIEQNCKTCRWLNSADSGAADGNTCRRHAPITEAGRQAHRMWPYVYETDWCGDWEKQ
jgi:hypothetical protein